MDDNNKKEEIEINNEEVKQEERPEVVEVAKEETPKVEASKTET